MRTFKQFLYEKNDGTRTLFESILVPEVHLALHDWTKHASNPGVVIGGCGASFYTKPRMTLDVDVIYHSEGEIPDEVEGFKRHRKGAFQHKKTHVEVEVLTPSSISVPALLVQQVIAHAVINSGVKIASASGIVAMKLQRLKNHDVGDIVLLNSSSKIDLTKYSLTKKNLEDFKEIIHKYS